jgi:hypothetical protein
MSEESDMPAVAVETDVRSLKKPRLLPSALLGMIVLTGCVVGGVWMYNETTLQKPLQRVLIADPRNHVVRAKAHFNGWIDTHSVVFDLADVAGDSSQMDVFRVLLQYAKEQKDHQYQSIILSAYGQKKFVIPGDYFQKLGREYDAQNPIYTIRTFSHHISTMDGTKPFPEPEGGLLWVFKEEMEQFNNFNKRWYLDDFLARHK